MENYDWMTPRLFQNSKLLTGLYKRLFVIGDSQSDLFFEARPWLENRELPPPWKILDTPEIQAKEEQLQLEKDEVLKAINEEEARLEALKPPPIQEKLIP